MFTSITHVVLLRRKALTSLPRCVSFQSDSERSVPSRTTCSEGNTDTEIDQESEGERGRESVIDQGTVRVSYANFPFDVPHEDLHGDFE